jgi:hypothetical protein
VAQPIELQQHEYIFLASVNQYGQSVILVYSTSIAYVPTVIHNYETGTVQVAINEKTQDLSYNSIYYFNNQFIQKHITYSDIGYKNVSTIEDIHSIYQRVLAVDGVLVR